MNVDVFLPPFNKRIDQIELRSCTSQLITFPQTQHCCAEIVYWTGETCFTLAYWGMDSEGFYLKFVGGRVFSYIGHPKEFWKLAKKGQKKLDEYFRRLDK